MDHLAASEAGAVAGFQDWTVLLTDPPKRGFFRTELETAP